MALKIVGQVQTSATAFPRWRIVFRLLSRTIRLKGGNPLGELDSRTELLEHAGQVVGGDVGLGCRAFEYERALALPTTVSPAVLSSLIAARGHR